MFQSVMFIHVACYYCKPLKAVKSKIREEIFADCMLRKGGQVKKSQSQVYLRVLHA